MVDLLRRASLLEPELEVVLGGAGVREELPRRLDLVRRVVVRGASDRDLVLRKIVAGTDERQRLQRLGGGTHEAGQLRIPGRRDDLPTPHGDGVDAVPRFDDSVAADFRDDGLTHDYEPYADLLMVGIYCMFSRCRPKMDTTTRRRKR